MTARVQPIACRAAVPGGFTKDDFDIDTVAGTVTCPAGQTVAITSANNVVFWIRCRTCLLHDGEDGSASEPPSPGGRVDRPGQPGRRRHSHAKVPGLRRG